MKLLKLASVTLAVVFTTTVQTYAQKAANHSLVLPSVNQLKWADQEIGAIFHFDLITYVPNYHWNDFGTHPDIKVFNPSNVNTDQWILAAKAAGAKYAILVAKHCSGFSLWPTAAHEYSVKNAPWKNGKGDLVKDFIASCKKYGVKPGIYASASANGYLHVQNPGLVSPKGPVDQKTYNGIVMQQLTELWTNYGKLFEIWFDGGVQPVKDGGPDVAALLERLQPDAVVFGGPSTAKNLLRWMGNEEGIAPYPNWATTNKVIDANGTLKQEEWGGSPDGQVWDPAETDFALRTGWQGGWFWKASDQGMFTLERLKSNYVTSIGRNSNMLIGIAVDTSGMVPAEDVKRLTEFGELIKREFKPVASTKGNGRELILNLGKASRVDGYLIREDIAKGERIRKYIVEAMVNGRWKKVTEGISVGNKRIELLKPIVTSKLRLMVTSSVAGPIVKQFAALNTLAK